MKVSFSQYTLTPRKQTNRLDTLQKKTGVLLKGILKDKIYFADYFPHLALGDRPVEIFLDEFKFQAQDYDRKVFDLLLRDVDFQKLSPKTFFNHQLWSAGEEIKAGVVKYKLQARDDSDFIPALHQGHRVRLDANGLFKKDECLDFLKKIPHLKQIDYMEDPLSETDWRDIPLPLARDFIEGAPFDYHIYKPNCEFLPKNKVKMIFSSYLGGNLGQWHSCAELLISGDLTLHHGVKTEGFYQEEFNFLTGSYATGFKPDSNLINRLYQTISALSWKDLCSM
jgi:hypothetical protein